MENETLHSSKKNEQTRTIENNRMYFTSVDNPHSRPNPSFATHCKYKPTRSFEVKSCLEQNEQSPASSFISKDQNFVYFTNSLEAYKELRTLM